MIRLFKNLSAPASIDDALARGRQHLDRGRMDAALESLLGALLVTHAREQTYASAVALLSGVLERMNQPRAALPGCGPPARG